MGGSRSARKSEPQGARGEGSKGERDGGRAYGPGQDHRFSCPTLVRHPGNPQGAGAPTHGELCVYCHRSGYRIPEADGGGRRHPAGFPSGSQGHAAYEAGQPTWGYQAHSEEKSGASQKLERRTESKGQGVDLVSVNFHTGPGRGDAAGKAAEEVAKEL